VQCFAGDHPHTCFQYLHLAELWHNTTYHFAIGTSPFHALYGRQPPTTLDLPHSPCSGTTIANLLHQHMLVLHALKQNLRWTRQRMCDQANRHRSERSFNPDNWVWVRLQPYRQQFVERHPCAKLDPRYSGPYQLIHRIDAVAYELHLPSTSLVFHVSLLRAFKGTHVASALNSPSHADTNFQNPLNPQLSPTPNPQSLSNDQPLHSPNSKALSNEKLMPPPNFAPGHSPKTLSNLQLMCLPNSANFSNPPLSHSPNSLQPPPIPTTHQ